MNRVGRVLFFSGLLIMVLAISLTPGFGQPALVRGDADFMSALGAPDLEAVAAGASSPTGVGRPPRVGPNTRANAPQAAFPAGLLGRSETSISGTDDGRWLVGGWNDAQGFCGPPFNVACVPQVPSGLSGYAYSRDSGMTWTDGGAPPIINNVFTRGDPWLDMGGFDRTTFFYANLAVHATTGASLGISVHRGHFAGSTFAWEDVQTFNSPAGAADFYDKEALAAAKDGGGAAYVSLTNFIARCNIAAFGFGQIEVWRTTNAGATWAGPAVVSPDVTFITDPATPGCGFTGTLQQSSAPAIGPNGEVYVAWQFGPTFNPGQSTNAEIRFARSLNGGVSFSTPMTLAGINSMRANPPVGYNRSRINDHPRVAVATSGPHRGRVYVVYYDAVAPVSAPASVACPPGITGTCFPQILTSSQVFLKYSDDQGATWSPAMPLGPAVPATGIKRWWPVVSVQPGGVVDVVYHESQEREATAASGDIECNILIATGQRRVGTNSSLVDTYWVQSTNGGASFAARIRMSTATTNWCTTASNIRPNFGDYIGAYSGGNRVLALWADGRNGVPDAFFATGLAAGRSP